MAGKRSNGEGSIRKTKSGSWRGEVMDGYTPDGKKNMIRFTAKTRAEVLDKIRTYRASMDACIRIDKKMRFSDWADTWYGDYKSEVQPSTYSSYQYTLKALKKGFADQPLAEILPIHINRFLDKLSADGYSLSMIRKCRAMLIQIFDAADSNGLILRNPARRAKTVRNKTNGFSGEHKEKDAFTEKEVSHLMRTLPDDLLGNSIRTLLGSGMRVQEPLALRPEDISEDGSVIRIEYAVKMVNGVPQLGPPKSVRSRRTIPIPEQFCPFVRYLREHSGTPHVWTCPGGSHLYGIGAFRRRFYTALENAGQVRRLSPHCCRHTYVTMLQASGVPMETIAALTGHADIKTTEGYLHQSAETLAKAVEVLNGTVRHQKFLLLTVPMVLSTDTTLDGT